MWITVSASGSEVMRPAKSLNAFGMAYSRCECGWIAGETRVGVPPPLRFLHNAGESDQLWRLRVCHRMLGPLEDVEWTMRMAQLDLSKDEDGHQKASLGLVHVQQGHSTRCSSPSGKRRLVTYTSYSISQTWAN